MANSQGRGVSGQSLVEAGVEVDARGEGGVTPLMLATFAGELEVARHLISHGADVNQATVEGVTPLIAFAGGLTRQANAVKIIELLVSNGAKVSTATNSGETALTRCTGKYGERVFRLLRES